MKFLSHFLLTIFAVAMVTLNPNFVLADGELGPHASNRHNLQDFYTKLRLHRNVQKFTDKIQNAKTSMLERYSNVDFLKAARKHFNEKRDLMMSKETTVNTKADLGAILEIFQLVQDECEAEIDAVIDDIFNLDREEIQGSVQALIQCVKAVFDDLLSQCMSNFDGLSEPVQCLMDLGVNKRSIQDAAFSGSDLKLTRGEKLQLLNAEMKSEARAESGFDSANDIEEKFQELEDKLEQVLEDLNEASCADLFGNVELPEEFACLSLLDSEDIEKFRDAVLEAFSGEGDCSLFARVIGLDAKVKQSDYDFFDDIFEGLDMFDEFDLELCTQELMDDNLKPFNQVFDRCSDIDNGALRTELEARYGAATGLNVQYGVLVSAVATAIYRLFA